MKKLTKLFIILFTIILTSGCFKNDTLEGATIYTTVYPIEYLTDVLYGYNSTIKSIYPTGTEVEKYELKPKQIEKYSKGDLFIYNGLTKERDIAKDFINKNKEILILDVSYGLKFTYGVEELWLSPNNYLMLAKNIEEKLIEISNNKYAKAKIEENYAAFEETISIMDADLRSVAKKAQSNDKETLIVTKTMFKFLESYGFKVLALDNEEDVSVIKTGMKNKKFKYIIMTSNNDLTEEISGYVSQYSVKTVLIDTMETLSEDRANANDNYLSIMNEFIDNIKTITK